MFRNNFKLIWRNLLRNKVTTAINFSGLTIGMAAAVLIAVYVINERQTDRTLPYPERTFRVLRVSEINKEPYDIGVTSAPYAPAFKQDYPAEIEDAVRVLDGSSIVRLHDKQFSEDNYYYADPNFLTFFGIQLAAGNPETALSRPHDMVLSMDAARKYFGDPYQAVGQTLRIDNDYDATITGLLADHQPPMHMDFDMVESTLALEDAEWWSGWWNNSLCTYIRLNPGTDAIALEGKLPKFMDKYFGKDFARMGTRMDLRLQPVRDIYFESATRYDPMRHGNRQAVNVFLMAALLLIVIACANYVNLSTARAVEKSREVGIHKVLGSGRKGIISKILGESLFISLVSGLVAAQLVILALPAFDPLFGVPLKLDWSPVQLISATAGVAILIGLLAGLYPGVLLSSFKPAFVLKGQGSTGERRTAGLRKALVVFQFVLSVGLLCSTFLIQQQLSYMRNKSLGFDKEHILIMSVNSRELYANRETFRQRLKQEPGVADIAFMNGIPGGHHDATTVDVPELNQNIRMRTAFADFEFVKTLGLQLVAGRDFDPRLASDSTRAAILNERAVKDLGLTPAEALGKKILLSSFDSLSREIVGIVADYHFTSLHDAIEPLVISTSFGGGVIAVKARGDRIPQVIAAAGQTWNRISPDFPFTYQFLDERLDRLYQSESRQGAIFALFAGIAIFIAGLGMFGLAAFAAANRTKEIGIRKVIGASVAGIVGLLSRDFLKPVFIGILIATPLAWYFMDNWLQDFAYRIDIHWWVFALAGLAALLVAFATVSFQSVKAALANPIKSLRNE